MTGEATMAEKDVFKQRERGLEEDYFRRKEAELKAKIRERAELEQERERISAAIGTTDQEILGALQDLGYNAETIRLIHLIPLVEVAWADGSVDRKERETILELARARGIEEGSEAFARLQGVLEKRPDDQFFRANLLAIRLLLSGLPPEDRNQSHRDLINYASTVARVSGGLLGFGTRISKEEQELLERLTRDLSPAEEQTARQILDLET
jgi:hypothetical protein